MATGMELLVLGAGPAYSDIPGSCGASYLVRAGGPGGDAVLLDLGQGAFPALINALEPSTLRAVVISHLHPDHFVDLIPLRHYLRRAEHGAGLRARVIAPPGLDERLDGAYATPGFAAAAFDLEAGEDGPIPAGGFELRSVRVTHAGESRAWRVALAGSAAPGLVYSGDASSVDELTALVRPGDTILSEASHGPDPVPAGMNHLNSAMVGELAVRTRAGAVIATHIRMGTDLDATVHAIRAIYPGPVGLARPGARFAIPGPPP
ncbi:MAG: MBL fold metallo-hydrolase [Chloroflexota bacterium]